MIALERELSRSAAGELRCVLVVGEAGVGKTRLATAVAERKRGTALGLSARAYPLGETASFGLWVEALDRHLPELTAEEIRNVCAGVLDDLAVLLNSVAVVRGSVPRREPPRLRLLEGLSVLLVNLASRAPVVLTLDDVHFADPSSWEALSYVARRTARTPVFVLATTRPEVTDQPAAAQVITTLEQEARLDVMRLEPLARDAVRELAETVLLKGVVADALVDWLDARTRVNPLFAIDLLRALVEEGANLSSPRLERLPERLRDRVGLRLQPLDESSSTRWPSGRSGRRSPRRRRRVHRHQSAARDDRLLEGSPDLARRGIVLFRLATFLGWDAGEAEEAQRLQERAIDLLAKGGDPGTALRAATELGFLRNAAGDFAAGERQARAVVRPPRLPATASPPCTHSAFWAGHTHI